MLITVGSVKGAPGATTLAVGLAALWPDPNAVLVECDPDGGDLAARFGHHPDPGLASLAAQARTGSREVRLGRHVQRLTIGVNAVLAPPGDGAAISVSTLIHSAAELMRRTAAGRPVVADVGRFCRPGPTIELAAAADHVLVVAGGELAEQVNLRVQLDWLRPQVRGRLWIVRAGHGAYSAAEISRALGVPVIADLPHSQIGAAVLAGRLRVPNWQRLTLARTIAGIGRTLAAYQPASRLEAQLSATAAAGVAS